MGSTLKALKDYIEDNGGNVVDAFVLGVGRLGKSLEAPTELKQKLIQKFGEKELNSFLNETGRKNIDSLQQVKPNFYLNHSPRLTQSEKQELKQDRMESMKFMETYNTTRERKRSILFQSLTMQTTQVEIPYQKAK